MNKEIKTFLKNNPSIARYIPEARKQIKKYFGDVKTNLEISFDPEYEDNEGSLVIKFKIKNSEGLEGLNSAMEKLETLDKEWLIPVVGKDIDKFIIDLDFI